MRSKLSIALALLLSLALLASVVPGCSNVAGAVESYVAVVPKVLHAGSEEAVSLALFHEGRLTSARVEVSLLKDGEIRYYLLPVLFDPPAVPPCVSP